LKATRKSRGPRKAIITAIVFAISLSIALLLFASAAIAGVRWTANGVAVTPGTGNAIPQVVPDDQGGSIVAWIGPGGPNALMVQRLDSSGNAMWTVGGVLVCNDGGLSSQFGIAPDASHGAYLTWIDRVAGPYDHVYAQHVDASGNLLTPPVGKPGMPVCEATNIGPTGVQANPSIAAGVAGEALITWEDSRNGNPKKEIFAQCIQANGSPRWTVDGVAVAQDHNDLQSPTIIPNSSVSCAVVYVDRWTGAPEYPRVLCQKLDLTLGARQWPTPGTAASMPVSTNVAPQNEPCTASDGGGGVIVAWNDARNSVRNIYAQRLSGIDGACMWGDSAVALRTGNGALGGSPAISRMTDDWNGGAIVAWEDTRGIYAQRVNSGGTPQWLAQGVGLSSGASKAMPEITMDGQAGAIVSWADGRTGQYNVYAQRITSGGAAKWTANGVPVCTVANAATAAEIHPYIASDITGGGATVTWHDSRGGPGSSKVYAQRVSNNAPGITGIAPWQAPGGTLNANISGTGFFNATYYSGTAQPTAKLKSGSKIIWAYDMAVVSETSITCKFNLVGAPVGSYDLYVWNPDGQSSVKTGAFRISTGRPEITGLSSTTAAPGDLLTITGVDFGNTRGGAGAGTTGGAEPSYVSFGGTQATDYKSWSNTIIEVYVPSGATSGSVSVVTGAGASNTRAVSIVYPKWYLAEGSTDWGFDCWISIINPNKTAVTCNITYMPTGSANVIQPVTLAAQSRATIFPKDKIGAKDFSTKVECTDKTKTIAVDRTMMWKGAVATTPEAHSSVGVTLPEKQWFLAEGSTAWGFECWLLIQNPNATQVTAHVTYMSEGGAPVNKDKVIPANSRKTFNVADDIGAKDASIQVSCDQGVGVIPERAMYRNQRREGHDSIGTTNPAGDYFLAEGTTNYGFTTYVLVQNPTQDPADVILTYMTNAGPKPQPKFTMPALSRKTVRVNDVMPNTDFSTQVHSNGPPIIAERAMYWDNGTGEATHDSIGMEAPHTTFYLPDGQAGSDVETFTLVQNPNATAVNITVTYLLVTGAPVTFNDTVPANSRKTYNMKDKGVSGPAGIVVTSTSSGKKIMCERAMYFFNRGAGTGTIGGYSD
jgi:hypothetical protein